MAFRDDPFNPKKRDPFNPRDDARGGRNPDDIAREEAEAARRLVMEMLQKRAQQTNPRSSQATENVIKGMVSHKPEIHPLATLEAQLAELDANCNLCKISSNGSDGKTPNVLQGSVIKAASKALESARNYEMNMPGQDQMAILYSAYIRPVIAPFFEGIGDYRKSEEVRSFLKEFVENNGGRRSMQFSGVDKTERGYITQFIEIISTDSGQNKLMEYFMTKGLGPALTVIEGLDREKLSTGLRNMSEHIRNTNLETTEIAGYMSDLMNACSQKCGYDERCDAARKNIEKSRELLGALRDKRNVYSKDISNGVSLVLDISAGVVENMTDEEYNGMRRTALEQLNQFVDSKRQRKRRY